MLSLVPLLLSLSLPFVHAASGQGEISLWSDNDCGSGLTTSFGERDPVALNYTLSTDICGTPGAATHSYQVLRRPTCPNGNLAAFAFYHGAGCKSEGFGPALNSVDNGSGHLDGECLALVEFNSLAFLCAGLGTTGGDGSSSAASASNSPSSTAVASSITLSASATPIAPSASMTSPIYTAPVGSSLPGMVPINTASGGSAPSASRTFPATPSASSFTGSASRFKGSVASVAGVIIVLGGAILL